MQTLLWRGPRQQLNELAAQIFSVAMELNDARMTGFIVQAMIESRGGQRT
jgi:hypothetical protein